MNAKAADNARTTLEVRTALVRLLLNKFAPHVDAVASDRRIVAQTRRLPHNVDLPSFFQIEISALDLTCARIVS